MWRCQPGVRGAGLEVPRVQTHRASVKILIESLAKKLGGQRKVQLQSAPEPSAVPEWREIERSGQGRCLPIN